MPRVKLHRPTSPDDRPQAPPDEFEAGLFPEIAAKPEKPKYEAWPDYVPAEPQHERTSYLPNVKQQALELFREGCGYKRTALRALAPQCFSRRKGRPGGSPSESPGPLSSRSRR